MSDERDYEIDGCWVVHRGDLNEFAIYEDGDPILIVPHVGAAPREWVTQIIRAYKKGLAIGQGVGATLARREMRVALGIESQDF